MYSDLRAAVTESAKKRSAEVLPAVGVVYNRPAAVSAPGLSVARPLVVDAEPTCPAGVAIDDDTAHVRAVLREMQR
jgi:hypothetical protein